MPKFSFTVHGVPQPKGSTKSFAFKRKDGTLGTKTTSDNDNLRPWADTVGWVARETGIRPTKEPVCVEINFWLPRPKGHFGKKGLRPSAPLEHTTKPDLDKLIRGALDALTHLVWKDDSQVVSIVAGKFYCSETGPGADITVSW